MGLGETPNVNYLSVCAFRSRQGSLQDSYLPEKRSCRLLHPIYFYLLLLFSPFLQAAPSLSSGLSVSTEGYFVLSWETPEPALALTLHQSSTPDFSAGLEEWSVTGASQFTQSGLVNGNYYFRLSDSTGFSNTVHVQVVHHSLLRASLFFSLGATLFGILVATLLLGQRGLREETPQ